MPESFQKWTAGLPLPPLVSQLLVVLLALGIGFALSRALRDARLPCKPAAPTLARDVVAVSWACAGPARAQDAAKRTSLALMRDDRCMGISLR